MYTHVVKLYNEDWIKHISVFDLFLFSAKLLNNI